MKSPSTLQHLTFPHDSSLLHTNLTRHVFIRNIPKPSPKASPNGSALASYCGRLRTVANIETTGREQGSTPRPPELNENRIRENSILDSAYNFTVATSQRKLSKQDPTTKATHQSKIPAPKQLTKARSQHQSNAGESHPSKIPAQPYLQTADVLRAYLL